ncbi:SDR family oxidoreductase [Sphingomicrobium aestuariivivum]|uniref:SDR family oxidoreductase n=1 Tax=Sphingomicrobium aestuariivivum TaxID=1582356 RepID=UPI001FD6ABA4|nr:SDR family oxidoreductase [Sphingomicrobium aestuariivivum]MCJ8191847.1 SDR family oxidoreductase [Sphingomicrobium aestuariivivum]
MTKAALVTGARHRIGAAIAAHLVDKGWRVFAHVRSQDDDVPEGCAKVVGDLADPDIGAALFAQVEGPCDLLVNNAAAFEHDGLEAPDAAMFERMMAVNARAPMLLTSAFAAHGASGGDRSIVNILDAKLAAPNADHLSYTLSKAALAGLNEVSARALAAAGIRVNAIAPALMLPSGPQDSEDFTRVHDLNPLGRGVEPAHLLEALDALVDNRVLTGQTLWLDAGQRYLALPRDVAFLGENQ